MPLPMVHLSVAVSMYETDGRFPSAEFLLGSIAPDAIHMRPDTDERDKLRVHLMESDPSPQGLLNIFQSRFEMDKIRSNGFTGGYLTHLLTDYFWRQAVIDPYRKRLLSTLPEKDVRSLYYRDTDQIDLDLYRQMPWRPIVWLKLKTATSINFDFLLTAEEIIQWCDRTLVWYDDPAHDPKAEPVYITRADTNAFIAQTAKEIVDLIGSGT